LYFSCCTLAGAISIAPIAHDGRCPDDSF
jgi:hypothetical protein